ncbi:MAG: septation protein SpoVG family protein [Fibrobacteraceae bacterium]|nr:septation protein SpoVG family protein [Fibrobacteraceae bacterium]
MNNSPEEKKENIQFDCLAVTNVQVYPFKEGSNPGKARAYAAVILNDQIQLRGIRVMDGINGLFVAYPNDPFYKGEDYHTIYCPISRQLREHIENCILERYQECIAA